MSRIVSDPPAPGSPQWRGMITASKIPAILGVSRWQSPFSLWQEMAGNVPPIELDPDRMAWGHIAETSLADWWLYKHPGWLLNPRRAGSFEIAYTNPDLPFANMATLDRRGYRPDASGLERFWIVECKTAMSLDDWGRPGDEDSVPADYFAQVQFQMGVSGIHRASAVVLGPHAEPEIHDIDFNEEQFGRIVDLVVDWEASLQLGIPPAADGSVSTYEAVRGLHPDIDPAGEVQIDEATAVAFLDRARAEAEGEALHRAAKIDAAQLMGSAKYLKCGDVKIADRRSKLGGRPYVQFNKGADLGA